MILEKKLRAQSFFLTFSFTRSKIKSSSNKGVLNMIEITYLDASKNERTITFESYDDFDRSQQACLIGVADYYPVQKLTYNGHDLDYHGTYGDIFFYLKKQDLSQYQGPILDKLSEELSEDVLKIVKMDVDENPNTARAFGIMSIPTLLFKKDGQVVKQVAGVHTAEQIKAIVAELS